MLSQKATILCLLDILKSYSDENHPISAETISDKLRIIYDVDMERRAVYRNISVLNEMGIEVQKCTDNRGGYCLIDREFAPQEIRLLCDAVSSSHFLSDNQCRGIISRLLKMLSIYQANEIKGTVYIGGEKRPKNSGVFYSTDILNAAISQCLCVKARLVRYNYKKEYDVISELLLSPYYTVCADNEYYLICRDEYDDEIKHFRVDKLKDITITNKGTTPLDYGFAVSEYTHKQIYLNGEREKRHTFVCDEDDVDSLIDYFGEKVTFKLKDDQCVATVMGTEMQIRRWQNGCRR